MKKYDSYKDSGVEWIGKVPENWGISKVKFLFDTQKGKTPKNLLDKIEENSLVYLAMDYLRGEPKQVFFVSNKENVVITNENETLLLWDGSNAGEFLKSKKGVLSSTMALIKSKIIDNQFQWYSFKSFESILKDSCNGMGIPHVDGKFFRGSAFLVPPIEEQQAIVNYLDHKTTQIDNLIAKKEQFIQLLEEERIAVINQAVTKGLDPNVSLRDSGIEWLGEIPLNWEVKKLKYVLKSIQGGGTPSTENDDYWNGNIPWVSPKDMKVRYIDSTKDYINQEAIQNSSAQLIMPGRLLMVVRSGILKHTLPLAINITEVSVNQDLKAIEVNDKIDTNFLYWLLYGKQDIVLTLCSKMGATVDSIDMEVFMNHKISIPPFSEQLKIVEYIEYKLEKIRSTNNCLSKEIKLLKEYKTALISEVVTGKVDVSNEKLN